MNTDIDANGNATCDEEYEMPCAEALLAATFALMTAHAQACCTNHKVVMSEKIVTNLTLLSQHALLSPDFKAMLWNLRLRWRMQLEEARSTGPAERDPRLWHAGTNSVQ